MTSPKNEVAELDRRRITIQQRLDRLQQVSPDGRPDRSIGL